MGLETPRPLARHARSGHGLRGLGEGVCVPGAGASAEARRRAGRWAQGSAQGQPGVSPGCVSADGVVGGETRTPGMKVRLWDHGPVQPPWAGLGQGPWEALPDGSPAGHPQGPGLRKVGTRLRGEWGGWGGRLDGAPPVQPDVQAGGGSWVQEGTNPGRGVRLRARMSAGPRGLWGTWGRGRCHGLSCPLRTVTSGFVSTWGGPPGAGRALPSGAPTGGRPVYEGAPPPAIVPFAPWGQSKHGLLGGRPLLPQCHFRG